VTPLDVALSGGVAGIAGALALVPLVAASRRALASPSHGQDVPIVNPLAPGAILSEASNVPPDLLQLTAVFVQKVATGMFGSSLSVTAQRRYGTLWHLGYGAFWGVGYALLHSGVAVSAVVLGPAYGLLVWALGPAWLVPRMRLMPPVTRSTRAVTALVVAWHVFYGSITAIVVALIGGSA
jgi:hypothetical protein